MQICTIQMVHHMTLNNNLINILVIAGAIAVTTGSFSETSLPHVLSNMNCQGSETNLLQCQYSTPDGCGPTEVAAVVCQGGVQICVYTFH